MNNACSKQAETVHTDLVIDTMNM